MDVSTLECHHFFTALFESVRKEIPNMPFTRLEFRGDADLEFGKRIFNLEDASSTG